MKRYDMETMRRDKEALREKLTALPFAEKLRLLDAMRERTLSFAFTIQASTSSQRGSDPRGNNR